jgi:formamidopyrimidine-DNA glycosylase (fpg)
LPELPEVETLRRGLERRVLWQRIGDVSVENDRVLKSQSPVEFRDRVVGTRITEVRRRGKYLLIRLEAAAAVPPSSTPAVAAPSSFILCVHLKMRGQLLLESASQSPGRYHCVSLQLDSGGSQGGEEEEQAAVMALRYYDMWAWGEMRALTEAEVAAKVPALADMGPEPLEAGWDGASLASRLMGRRTAIKSALLDQRVVAGVGNIYADESLFRAGIHPERRAQTLSREETDRLASAVRAVLTEAVSGGGTESEDYTDLAGSAGRYVPRVYDRGGSPCPACGETLIRIRLGGRGTVFCGSCQSPG